MTGESKSKFIIGSNLVRLGYCLKKLTGDENSLISLYGNCLAQTIR